MKRVLSISFYVAFKSLFKFDLLNPAETQTITIIFGIYLRPQ